MRVDWFSCFRGDGGNGEVHVLLFSLSCVLVLSERARLLRFCRAVILPGHGLPGACCRLFRVRLYHMSCLLFCVSRVFGECVAPLLWYSVCRWKTRYGKRRNSGGL